MGLIQTLLGFFGKGGLPVPDIITDELEPEKDSHHHFVQPVGSAERVYRPFRLTYYLIAEQLHGVPGSTVPIYDPVMNEIARVDPKFFSYLSLQGSGRLLDGRLINVSGHWCSVRPDDYASVLNYHNFHLPKRPVGYSGIALGKDGRVAQALCFSVVPKEKEGIGYGMMRGEAHRPFRTLAADIGTSKKSDPNWKGQGGLVPPHTRVHIKELVGLSLPDGTVHDGWTTVIDSGGGIFGAHFDLFVGTQGLKDKVKLPGQANIWFEGIEKRIPADYTYGLKDV